MTFTPSLTLLLYGGFLVISGILGYFITGETSTSSLLNGGIFGTLLMVLGILIRQGRMWTMPAAVSATAMFTLTFVWRSVIQWSHVVEEGTHVSVAILLTIMMLVSVVVLRYLAKHYRH